MRLKSIALLARPASEAVAKTHVGVINQKLSMLVSGSTINSMSMN